MSESTLSTNDVLKLIEKMGEQNKIAIAEAVATAVAESKKPAPPTQQELSEIEQANEHRAQTADSVKQTLANKRSYQLMCSHEHTKREGGGTHCVWVKPQTGDHPAGYIYCQRCEIRVRPENADQKLDPGAYYSNNLFNRLFQDCNEGEVLGG